MRDLRIVQVLLDEVQQGGSGAYRRAAGRTGALLSTVGATIEKVENLLGAKLLETGPKGRRLSAMTAFGEAFRGDAAKVLAAWEQAIGRNSGG